MDVARTQCQGWRVGSTGCQCQGDGESRPQLYADLSADGPVLGRPARHERPCLCGCLCADAICFGALHCERTDEMGVAGCHGAEHSAVVGAQLYAVHRLLLGLCAHV